MIWTNPHRLKNTFQNSKEYQKIKSYGEQTTLRNHSIKIAHVGYFGIKERATMILQMESLPTPHLIHTQEKYLSHR